MPRLAAQVGLSLPGRRPSSVACRSPRPCRQFHRSPGETTGISWDIVEMSKHYSSTARAAEGRLPVLLSIPLANRAVVWSHIGFAVTFGSAFPPAQLMLLESIGSLLDAFQAYAGHERCGRKRRHGARRLASGVFMSGASSEAAAAIAECRPEYVRCDCASEIARVSSRRAAARNRLAVLRGIHHQGLGTRRRFEQTSWRSPYPPSSRIDVYSRCCQAVGSKSRLRSAFAATSQICVRHHPSTANFSRPYTPAHWPVSVSPPSA